MRGAALCYGDLHFHTRLSDNRDRASVEQMVTEGARRGLVVLGTGDHHHNITAGAWRRHLAESRQVRRRHPEIVLLSNCEVTFLIGHAVAIDPGRIAGTIAEAYGFLRGTGRGGTARRPALKMIAHPGLPGDEWNTRILPDAAALEIVNGAVLRQARAAGIEPVALDHPLSIPPLVTFVRYLAAGIPVAAMGSSDAHRLAEMGFGVTGFWLPGRPTKAAVLEAIRSRRTFAATSRAISIRWELGEDGALEWHVDSSVGQEVRSWLFVLGRLVVAGYETGRIERARLPRDGFCWIAARCGEELAVSSAIILPPGAGAAEPASPLSPHEDGGAIRREAARLLLQDRALSAWTASDDAEGAVWESGTEGTQIELAVLDPHPSITDAGGSGLAAEVLRVHAARAIIDRTDSPDAFEELLVWLARNEVHEYRFGLLRYGREGGTFRFEAFLLPAVLDRRPLARSRYRRSLPEIARLLRSADAAQLCVSLMPRCVLRLPAGSYRLPLRVQDRGSGIASEIHAVRFSERPGELPPDWLEGLPPEGESRLVQFFVSTESAGLIP